MTAEPVDLEALAAPLRGVVAALDAGGLAAGPLARAYLAGALAALDAAAGGPSIPRPDLTQ
jgi:hypothetical protein